MALLLMMNNGILMASEDRSDIVFSCVLTDELAHCASTNSFTSVISQMALLNLVGFKQNKQARKWEQDLQAGGGE